MTREEADIDGYSLVLSRLGRGGRTPRVRGCPWPWVGVLHQALQQLLNLNLLSGDICIWMDSCGWMSRSGARARVLMAMLRFPGGAKPKPSSLQHAREVDIVAEHAKPKL